MTERPTEVMQLSHRVVHMPGRPFPAVVLQGDTLHTYVADLERVARELDPEERTAQIEYVLEALRGLFGEYEETCREHGIGLPYVKAPRS